MRVAATKQLVQEFLRESPALRDPEFRHNLINAAPAAREAQSILFMQVGLAGWQN